MPNSTTAVKSTLSGNAVLSPFWVSRINLFPHRELRGSPENVAESRLLLAGLAHESDLRTVMVAALTAQLEALAVSLTPEERKQFVLPFKRDVFNRRRSREALRRHPLATAIPEAADWLSSWKRTADYTARLDGREAQDLRDEREVLRQWCADPDVQRSIAMTSADLLGSLRSRAEANSELSQRMRKAEPTLVQYFSRSTVKVSPFSLYTGVHFARVGTMPATSSRLGFTSSTSLRRLLVRQAFRRLAADPVDSQSIAWQLNDSVSRTKDAITVRRRLWRDAERADRAEGFTEDDIRLPLSASWTAIIDLLHRHGADRPPVLAETIASTFSWAPADATRLLDRLIEHGAVVPLLPVPEQSLDYESRWLEFLGPLSGPVAADFRLALQDTQDVLEDFDQRDGPRRAATVSHLTDRWSAAVGQRVDSPLVEDCLLANGLPVAPSRLARWAADTEAVLPLLLAVDDQRLLAKALEMVFVDAYGRGGRCDDIRAFALAANRAFPLAQQLLSGEFERSNHIDPHTTALLRARSQALDLLLDLSRSGGDEVNVLQDGIDRIADLMPEGELGLNRSLAVFGQPDGERLVLNHLYGGRSRYFSRYLNDLPATNTAEIRRYGESLVPAGAVSAQLRSTLGFNANLTPLLAPHEITIPNETPGSGIPLDIRDLSIVHTGTGLSLEKRREGHLIDLLYAGFLVPHALPSEEMLLAMLAGSPYIAFGELSVDLYNRSHPATEPPRAPAATPDWPSTPRIVSGSVVLFRRRWAVSAKDLLPGDGESSLEHYRRTNVARLANGVSEQAFMRALPGNNITPVERAMSPKPQHIDFLSRLHTKGIRRRLDRLGECLMLEEFLPHPGTSGLASDRGTHASELFFELSPRVRHQPGEHER